MADYKILTIISVLIGFGSLITVIILYTATGGNVPFDYGIVLDAGSSHTQVTLYQWLADKYQCTGVVKQTDTTNIKGGIANYNDIEKVGESLLPYVTDVSNKIESDRLSKTSIYLGATAGMRMLNATEGGHNKVLAIFSSIRETFKTKTKLQTESISIISGQDEGLFSWIAANYLTQKLNVNDFNDKSEDSAYGMLDMGGASAQIAYRLTEELRNKSVDPSDHVDVRLYGFNHTVKSSSNLCFGADQSRYRFWNILILNSTGSGPITNPCLHKGTNETIPGITFKDQICLERRDTKTVDTSRNYTFTGTGDSQECQNIVSSQLLDLPQCEKTFITCFTVSIVPPPSKTKFYALSTYFYTNRVLNISTTISMHEYMKKINNFCSTNMSTIKLSDKSIIKQDYTTLYCFQLHYIYATLTKVYRFDNDSWNNIYFENQINGTQLGWSLGFMIKATNVIPSEKPSPPIIQTIPFAVICIISALIIGFGIYFALKWKGEGTPKEEQYLPINLRT